MKKSTTVLCYTVYLCVCSILLLKGSTPDINNSSSHTLGALYHVVVVALPLLIRLELLTHNRLIWVHNFQLISILIS